MRGYYFITDAGLSKAGNISDVKNAVEAGIEVVQYRNKTQNTRHMTSEAAQLKKICKDAAFLINDRVDVALAVDADGVHLGQDDMPYEIARELLGKNKIIGLTVHNVEEAIKAEQMGADYIGLSPIFATSTKSDAGEPCGTVMITKVREAVKIPTVAIGGITLENAGQAVEAGADCVCAMSAVLTKEDVKEEIMKFQRLFK